MSTTSVAEAKSRFSDLLRRAEYGGERIVVHRHGKPVAAIVSTADLEQLEALEEARDVADARTALKEAKQQGTIALEVVLKKYHLEHLLGTASTRRPPQAPGSAARTSHSARPKPAQDRPARTTGRRTTARQR